MEICIFLTGIQRNKLQYENKNSFYPCMLFLITQCDGARNRCSKQVQNLWKSYFTMLLQGQASSGEEMCYLQQTIKQVSL